MEILFEGIDLDKISVSMTINGPAVIIFSFYFALAIKRGIDISKLNGTLQNDILKEYIAQKEWIYPPKESIRIIVDMIKYCTEKMPKYNTHLSNKNNSSTLLKKLEKNCVPYIEQ